jgi:hypothetical protein
MFQGKKIKNLNLNFFYHVLWDQGIAVGHDGCVVASVGLKCFKEKKI